MQKDLKDLVKTLSKQGINLEKGLSENEITQRDLISLKIALNNCDHEKWNSVIQKINETGLNYSISVDGQNDLMTLKVGEEEFNLDFRRSSFSDKDFSKFNLGNTSFSNISFESCQINGANKVDLNIDNCKLDDVLITNLTNSKKEYLGNINISGNNENYSGVVYQQNLNINPENLLEKFESYNNNHSDMRNFGCEGSAVEKQKEVRKDKLKDNVKKAVSDIFLPEGNTSLDIFALESGASFKQNNYYGSSHPLIIGGEIKLPIIIGNAILYGNIEADIKNHYNLGEVSLDIFRVDYGLGATYKNFDLSVRYNSGLYKYSLSDGVSERIFDTVEVPAGYEIIEKIDFSGQPIKAAKTGYGAEVDIRQRGLSISAEYDYNSNFSIFADYSKISNIKTGREDELTSYNTLAFRDLSTGEISTERTSNTVVKQYNNEYRLGATINIPLASSDAIKNKSLNYTLFLEGAFEFRDGLSMIVSDIQGDLLNANQTEVKTPRITVPNITAGVKVNFGDRTK